MFIFINIDLSDPSFASLKSPLNSSTDYDEYETGLGNNRSGHLFSESTSSLDPLHNSTKISDQNMPLEGFGKLVLYCFKLKLVLKDESPQKASNLLAITTEHKEDSDEDTPADMASPKKASTLLAMTAAKKGVCATGKFYKHTRYFLLSYKFQRNF